MWGPFLNWIKSDFTCHLTLDCLSNISDDAIKNLDEDEKEQERLAKRFAKRARMQRLLETYGEDDEFTQSRLIDEDNSMKIELKKMKVGNLEVLPFCDASLLESFAQNTLFRSM